MATLAMGVVGAGIGASIGGTFLGMSAVSIGWSLGTMAGQLLFAPDQPDIEGPRLKDKGVTVSSYGADIPSLFGTTTVSGNVFWSTDKKERKVTQSAGKGLFGGGPSATSYSYSVSMAVSLCTTEIADVLKIWADGNLIFDKTSATDDMSNPNINFRVHKGTETQLPDSVMLAELGADACPAYRGQAYIVFEDFELEDYGQRIPQLRFLIAETVAPTTPSIQISDETAYSSVGSNWHIYRDDLGIYLYRDLWTFRRVNPKTMEILWTLEDMEELFLIDDFGRLYARNRLNELEIRDARTGDLILNYDPPTNDYTAYLDSGILLDLRPIGGENMLCCLDTLVQRIRIFDADTLEYYGSAKVPDPIDHYNFRGYNLVIDDSGNLWGVVWGTFLASVPDTQIFKVLASDIKEMVNKAISLETPQLGIPYTIWAVSNSEIRGPLSTQTSLMDLYPLYWNAANGTLVCLTNNAIAEWDPDTELFISRNYVLPDGVYNRNWAHNIVWMGGDPRRGYIFYTEANSGYWINTKTWERTTIYIGSGNPWGLFHSSGYSYGRRWAIDYAAHAVIGTFGENRNGETWKIFLERVTGGTADLAAIVGALLVEAGFTAADYDLTVLVGTDVMGVNFAQMARARDMLVILQKTYFFDLVESDFKIVAVLRGGAYVTTIPEADIVTDNKAVEEVRTQESELPEVVNLKFIDAARDYEISGTAARRIANPNPTMYSRAQSDHTLPVVLTPGEAAQLTEKMLFANWSERRKIKLGLPWSYLAQNPSDVILLDLASGAQQCRIDRLDVGANLQLEADLTIVDDGTYSSTRAADGGQGHHPAALNIAPPVVLYVLDTPLLRDGDNPSEGSIFVYGALGCTSAAFRGANVYLKQTDGTWSHIATATAQASYGVARSVLADADAGVLDTVSSLTIAMVDGGDLLTSATTAVLLDGTTNAILVGDEILQFANVTDNGDGTYTLDTFYRGRRGTEWATPGHALGDMVYILDTSLFAIPLATEDVGTTIELQAVHWGLSDGVERSHSFEGSVLKPYAPAQFEITDNGTTLDLAWIRRNRINAAWEDGYSEIVNSEATETYQIDITFDGVTVTKTVIDATIYSYTAAQFEIDFSPESAFPAGIIFEIYQISAVVGRGYAATESY